MRQRRRSVLIATTVASVVVAAGVAVAVTRDHDAPAGTATPTPRATSHAPRSTPSVRPPGSARSSLRTGPARPVRPVGGNPLSMTDGLYVDPQSEPASWVAGHPTDSRRAAISTGIADVPMGRWYNGDGSDASDAAGYVSDAARRHKLPVLVLYDIVRRGCGSEGAATPAAYRAWIDRLAAAVGGRPAVVILEPDALPGLDCLSSAEQATRYDLLGYAVDRFAAVARNTWTYLDAGHDDWKPATTIAQRLRDAGVARARGFSLNVSNYQSTSRNVGYAHAVDAALGRGTAFVIDTSRNGKPSDGADWCNPPGQQVGSKPQQGGASGLDLQLWVKIPGESDGDCGIGTGTYAGEFSPAIAMQLLGR